MLKENEVLNELLGYERMKIIQRPDLFNFSLDSTLLADFVTLNRKALNAVDLCAGNGPIPLFLSIRSEKLAIYGVELQEVAYDLGKRSVELNGLDGRIKMLHADVKGIHQQLGEQAFDVVTCNPPFFKVDPSSNLNRNNHLTIARHETKVTLADVVREASLLLKHGGNLALVHRPERLVEIMETLRAYKLEPKRLRMVYPKVGREANTILIEARKGNPGGLKILPPLYVYHEDGTYTNEIKRIFHLGAKD